MIKKQRENNTIMNVRRIEMQVSDGTLTELRAKLLAAKNVVDRENPNIAAQAAGGNKDVVVLDDSFGDEHQNYEQKEEADECTTCKYEDAKAVTKLASDEKPVAIASPAPDSQHFDMLPRSSRSRKNCSSCDDFVEFCKCKKLSQFSTHETQSTTSDDSRSMRSKQPLPVVVDISDEETDISRPVLYCHKQLDSPALRSSLLRPRVPEDVMIETTWFQSNGSRLSCTSTLPKKSALPISNTNRDQNLKKSYPEVLKCLTSSMPSYRHPEDQSSSLRNLETMVDNAQQLAQPPGSKVATSLCGHPSDDANQSALHTLHNKVSSSFSNDIHLNTFPVISGIRSLNKGNVMSITDSSSIISNQTVLDEAIVHSKSRAGERKQRQDTNQQTPSHEYRCKFCNYLTESLGCLFKHWIQEHDSKCLYQCPHCNRQEQKLTLIKHICSKHVTEDCSAPLQSCPGEQRKAELRFAKEFQVNRRSVAPQTSAVPSKNQKRMNKAKRHKPSEKNRKKKSMVAENLSNESPTVISNQTGEPQSQGIIFPPGTDALGLGINNQVLPVRLPQMACPTFLGHGWSPPYYVNSVPTFYFSGGTCNGTGCLPPVIQAVEPENLLASIYSDCPQQQCEDSEGGADNAHVRRCHGENNNHVLAPGVSGIDGALSNTKSANDPDGDEVSGSKYPCPYCDDIFVDRSAIVRHVSQIHGFV